MAIRASIALFLSLAILCFLSGCQPEEARPQHDLLITGATVIDPVALSASVQDVAVTGDRIAAVGDLSGHDARTVIDGTGLHLAPGFIDTHSHTADALVAPDRSGAVALLHQGITTVVINPDGWSPVDLNEQRRSLLEHGLGVNVAQMIGHGAVRQQVLGMQDRLATEEELVTMAEMVRDAMEAGAFGLSSGPFYAPGSYSDTAELIALAKVAAEYGGIYQSHIRDESNYTIGLQAAVDEVISVAEDAGATGIVTHIKALGPPVWGLSGTIIENIEQARARGVAVFADQYPYPASATGLAAALVPRWAQADGHDAFLARLEQPEERQRLVASMHENLARRGGAERIQFRRVPSRSEIEGRTLASVAQESQLDPVEQSLLLLAEGDIGVVSFNMDDADLENFMSQPWTMTASDGAYPVWGEGVPHPRGLGTFPRRIRRYSLDRAVLPLAETVRSMTALPAQVFSIEQRGVITEGAYADLVLFDSSRLQDRATFEQPYQLAEGIVLVIVNGQIALQDRGGRGPSTSNEAALAGRVLSRRTD